MLVVRDREMLLRVLMDAYIGHHAVSTALPIMILILITPLSLEITSEMNANKSVAEGHWHPTVGSIAYCMPLCATQSLAIDPLR